MNRKQQDRNDFPVKKTQSQWQRELSPEAYHVLWEHGTEPAFANKYFAFKGEGRYVCAGCGQELFLSKDKFDSGTGWPSFTQPAAADAVGTKSDRSLFLERIEVHCSRCGGHLGHVFDDGPAPGGLRYCMNSAALIFHSKAAEEREINDADTS